MQQLRGSFNAGDIIADDYLVIGTAGAGGMGVVYRAKDLRLERVVALKFLPPKVDASEHEKERFLREARTASSIDHPNIGVIHAIDETPDGLTFIVMAFYEGKSLAEKIRSGPLPPAEAVDIAIQVACGLQAAHHHRVVHRDIKPSNLMFTESIAGPPVPNGAVKIVDFGLAQFVSDRTASVTTVEGTVRYMAPEQVSGGVIDHAADQWALGAVLAEMLTGTHPFECDSVGATFAAILSRPPSLEGVPVELQRIIYKALAKEPANRFSSCEEMMRELEAVRPLLAGTSAVEAPKRSSIWRPGTGHSRSASAQRELVLASGSSATVEAQRTRKTLWIAIGALALVVLLALGYILTPRFSSAPLLEKEKHVAVLPFDNIGNNPENQVLIEGLMAALAGKLSNLQVDAQPLWVIPSSEVRRLHIADPVEARKLLGATLVIKGSIERDGSAVHLTLGLIDTRTLRQIGSAELEDPDGDLASLENDAVLRLADLMKATAPTLRKTARKSTAAPGAKPLAYEEYLKAVAYMDRYDRPSNLDLAVDMLRKAITIDPNFALGYAQLGEVDRLKYQVDQDPRWLAEAEASAKKAVELDPDLPAPYSTLGFVHEASGKHDLALEEFQQALKLDPTNVVALESLGRAYEQHGRTADAEEEFRKAVALKPSEWTTYNELGRFEQRQEKDGEAIDNYKRALRITPDNAYILLNLGGAYADSNDPRLLPLAEQALRESLRIQPSFAAYANLGSLYLHQHRFEEAAQASHQAVTLNDRNWEVWRNLADSYAWLKQPGPAADARQREIALLEKSLRTGGSGASVHSQLARAYAAQHEKQKALTEISAAQALGPSDPDVLESIADAYQDLGDSREAAKAFDKALKLGLTRDSTADDPEIQPLLEQPHFRAASK